MTGSPCDLAHPCPAPLVCASSNTCERDAAHDAGPDAAPPDSPPIPGCEVIGFDICNDGIDQDCVDGDAVCAANDLPGDAIDLTAGGTVMADLLLARDDVEQHGCGSDGGRDVFYRVTLAAPQVYYFATFGSNFDVTVRVFPGKACTALGTAFDSACSDDECNSANAQLAVSLPAGTSCVVVDQNSAATTGGLVLETIKGGRDGEPLVDSVSGDTCNSTNVFEPTNMCNNLGSTGGKDDGYFFTLCPGETAQVDATTCSSATSYKFDTVIYVRKAGAPADTACNDDDDACPARPERPDHVDGSTLDNVTVTGRGLYWLVVDGYQMNDCGEYTLANMVN